VGGALRDRAGLLSAWEAAAALPPVARAAALVERAGLVDDLDAALDLPVGEGAALAVRLHADAFGDVADGVATCEACATVLDVTVPLTALAAPPEEAARVVGHGDRQLRVRAPTTRDLLAVRDVIDPARALLGACVTQADGAPADPAALDDELLGLVDDAAEELAGIAATIVRVTCPECGASVAAPLDVGALLWERVERAAEEALLEVAELAAAYGWSEAQVLALTPTRRRAYVELARGGS
jgi:hypothetical protein